VRARTVLGAAGVALFLGGIAWDLIRETRGTMARFKREKKLYRLKFDPEDYPDLEGFECDATGTTLERFIEITVLATVLETPEGRTPENVEKQYRLFARYLKAWNLDDDDDQPVPCTYEGLKSQELDFVLTIMKAWMAAIASVPGDLGKDSPSGGTSPEASLHLASVSGSLAS
jgi:hypothetical protein